MTMKLFQTSQYRALMAEYLTKTITYLFEQNQEFAIACETKYITFEPELPEGIKESFNETVLFVLSGYTYETAQIEKEVFTFEAGFGNDNFGSLVTVPLLAIKQLFVEDHPIIINLAEPTPVQNRTANVKNSMEALLNNPENKKLLKKKP